MSALSKKQFPWTKRYNEQTGETHHIHTDSGNSVFNTLTGRHRWQIKGGSNDGELHTSLGKAKKVIEDNHDESNWNNMTSDQKTAYMKANPV